MQQEEREAKVFEFRPPNLWNEPSSLEDKHEFKCSANPFIIYNDPRVADLYNQVETLAVVIRTNDKARWKDLVVRIIDVFKHEEELLNESNL